MFSRRSARSAAAFAIAGAAGMLLAGCAHDAGKWRVNYNSLTDARFDRVAKDEVQIVSGDFDTLTMSPQIDGVACIGTTRFKSYGQLATFESDPDRTLRPHAAEKGAELVRWAVREVAPADRNIDAQWEYVAVYYRGFWRPEVASAGN